MNEYICAACGKRMNLDESPAFCPFCGRPYGQVAPQSFVSPVNTTRIVIGSDSERTIQEKYWHSAQEILQACTTCMINAIPQPMLSRTEDFGDDEAFLRDLRKGRSNRAFRDRCDARLQELQDAFASGEMPEKTRILNPLNVRAEAVRIRETGISLARAMGAPHPEALAPMLRYEPVAVDEKPVEQRKIPAEWMALMAAVSNARTQVYTLVEEEGVYAALDFADSAYDGRRGSPRRLAMSLRSGMEETWDPLFGGNGDDFLEAFWAGLFALAEFLKRAVSCDDLLEAQEVGRDALERFIEDWHDALERALDQAYQAQEKSMLQIEQEMNRIYGALQETEAE